MSKPKEEPREVLVSTETLKRCVETHPNHPWAPGVQSELDRRAGS